MNSCKKQISKKYTKRKSPPYPANKCKNKTLRGNDGLMYVSKPNKNKVFRWVKKKTRNLKGLEFTKWKERSRKYWLTIKDITKMKSGEKMQVLMLDRNALDWHFESHVFNKLYKPSKFFKNNKETYTHSKELYGNITYCKHNITFDDKEGFHVEYMKGNWYPLLNEHLPSNDIQGIFPLLGKKVHWRDMNRHTPIGWRGPLIKWDDIDKLPNVYLAEN